MPNTRKIWLGVCAVFGALISPLTSYACSIVYPTVQVGRTFRVKVMDHSRPVEGLRLVLTHSDFSHDDLTQSASIYSVTNADGFARFTDLTPGLFLVTSDHDAGVADGVMVKVSIGGVVDATIPLQWPNAEPLHVRSLSGTLRGPEFYPGQMQVPISLSLLHGVSTRAIAAANTDSKGHFRFSDAVPPGIYFLRLNPSELRSQYDGEQIEGMIVVEINGNAKESGLDLDLGWSTCGLRYSQPRQHAEMRVSKLCGDVADMYGAAISKAQIILLEGGEDADILNQTQSEADGQFMLKGQHEGHYQLLVKSPGFGPFLRAVHLVPSEASTDCHEPIRIRLGPL